jgi:hypothetical protein
MFRNLFQMLMWKRDMENQSRWFDKNEPAQARFEENEEWLEELEGRIIQLEEHSHPPKDLCEFDSYEDFKTQIKQMVKDEIRNQSGQK